MEEVTSWTLLYSTRNNAHEPQLHALINNNECNIHKKGLVEVLECPVDEIRSKEEHYTYIVQNFFVKATVSCEYLILSSHFFCMPLKHFVFTELT